MSRQQIIEDILAQAQIATEEIRSRSRESLKQREVSLLDQEKRIADEAETRIATQESDIRRQSERHTDQEIRRIELELQDRTVREVTARTRRELTSIRERDTEKYRKLLESWAAEAVLGLGLDSTETAVLRCAPGDRTLLKGVLSGIRETLGSILRSVASGNRTAPEIKLDERELPAETMGVMALDGDGRRAFSNTLEDRLRRSAQDIHRIVITEIFTESNI